MDHSLSPSSRFHHLWNRNPELEQISLSQSMPSSRSRNISSEGKGAPEPNPGSTLAASVSGTNSAAALDDNCSVVVTKSDLDRDFHKAVVYLQALTQSYHER